MFIVLVVILILGAYAIGVHSVTVHDSLTKTSAYSISPRLLYVEYTIYSLLVFAIMHILLTVYTLLMFRAAKPSVLFLMNETKRNMNHLIYKKRCLAISIKIYLFISYSISLCEIVAAFILLVWMKSVWFAADVGEYFKLEIPLAHFFNSLYFIYSLKTSISK
jgi:hypothetical protein